MQQRFWEIDATRGIAVVLMILFNWVFALQYLAITSLDWGWLFWWLFPRAIAAMFILVAGLSFTISYCRMATSKKETKAEVYKKYLLRGGKIFSLGILATAATWIFFPQATIFFGILHFLGAAIMLAPFLGKAGKLIPLLAAIFIAAGIFLQTFAVSFPWLLWLGVVPENFYTFDYFPLLPWLGVFMTGMFLGNKLYNGGKRAFKIRDANILTESFSFLGRHSLLSYVLHQPALLLALYLLGFQIL